MKHKSVYLAVVLAVCLAFIGVTLAQRPEDGDLAKHPNLAEADHHIMEAVQKIDVAQQATHDQLGGHAEKAKQLLEQASHEVREAATWAEHHK